jgi:bifunctional UDP-N-acetylglucosamine pyrophosphorylase / glucosamine-1-phosphate N-acetyltransferase
MRSSRPKPLHPLCGRPLILHVLDALAELQVTRAVVVVGHGAERVTKTLLEQAPAGLPIEFVEQHVQRGTGEAASVALTAFPDDELDLAPSAIDDAGGDIIVLPGDTPLLRPATLAALVRNHRRSGAAATVLTAELSDPAGYGRIVRDKSGQVARVIEDLDAQDQERAIREVNTSIYVFRRSVLAPTLRRLSPENAQGEYYLTDTLAVLHDAGYPVGSMLTPDPMEAAGVNDRAQLAAAEAELRDRINERWMRRGVTMLDPERTYLDTRVELGADVTLYPGTLLRGRTIVASGAEIGPDTHLIDCLVGHDAVVANTVGREAEIGDGAVVGPFAYLPPGVQVAPGAVTGPHFEGRINDDDGSPPGTRS